MSIWILIAPPSAVLAVVAYFVCDDFVWSYTIPEGETYLDLIEDNLYGVMSMVIVAGGETEFDPYDASKNYTLKNLGDYIARVAVNQFVKQMDIPNVKEVTMAEVAYLGLRESHSRNGRKGQKCQ